MRILYVCADRGIPVHGDKGASIHIQEMVRAFTALGHEVKILCARSGQSGSGVDDFDIRQVVSPVKKPEISREAKERNAIAVAESIEETIRAIHSIWPIDLIYERYSLWSAAGCRAGNVLSVPVIVEVNAPLINEQASFRQLVQESQARQLEAEVFQTADVLVSVSSQLTQYLVSNGALRDRVHTVGNAVDTRRFSPAARPVPITGIGDNHFVVGFSGSLKRWHGIDILLQAFQQFHQLIPESRLLLIGDGPKRGWAEGFAAGAGLAEAIVFTGWVPHSVLPSLIARMDVATAPYPESELHYFSPLKLYEYLAVGRPILASRIGQTAELLEDDQQAMLVEPGNVDALVRGLTTLHSNPQLAGRLARSAAREGRRHDWRRNAQLVVELVPARVPAYG